MVYMNKLTLNFITLLSCFLLLLSGCSSINKNQHQKVTEHQSRTERNKNLSLLTDWKIKGKMAIISPEQRHSVTLNWHYQGDKNSQILNLTTVLGIQVFNLESVNGIHVVNFDGERYQGPNLNELLTSLTGFTLPTQAMTFWLKGLPYLNDDTLTYQPKTQLPQTLNSKYDGKEWQIKYGRYQQVEQYQLATKFTIKQETLTLKINIHQWDVAVNDK
jgi:outer membrane lipoprotein LolB